MTGFRILTRYLKLVATLKVKMTSNQKSNVNSKSKSPNTQLMFLIK